MSDYVYLPDLAAEVTVPQAGILSRTLHQDERLKSVLFGFDTGQELSEHTAATPASLYIVQGEADVTLGTDKMDGKAGTWVHMPPNLPHSIKARSPLVMLLLLHKTG
jgi:quercetin dioxygenase-like cupin family protein